MNNNNNLYLEYKFTLYVPSTEYSEAISREATADRVYYIANYFSDLFGGATIENESTGVYKANSGETISKKIIKVTAFATKKAYSDNRAKIYQLAEEVRKLWQQESILIEDNQKAVLVF